MTRFQWIFVYSDSSINSTGAVAPLLLFGLQCCLGQAHFEDLQPEHFVLEKKSKNIVDEASKQKTHLFGPKANESNPLALVLPTLTHTPKQKVVAIQHFLGRPRTGDFSWLQIKSVIEVFPNQTWSRQLKLLDLQQGMVIYFQFHHRRTSIKPLMIKR